MHVFRTVVFLLAVLAFAHATPILKHLLFGGGGERGHGQQIGGGQQFGHGQQFGGGHSSATSFAGSSASTHDGGHSQSQSQSASFSFGGVAASISSSASSAGGQARGGFFDDY